MEELKGPQITRIAQIYMPINFTDCFSLCEKMVPMKKDTNYTNYTNGRIKKDTVPIVIGNTDLNAYKFHRLFFAVRKNRAQI